MAKDKNTPKQTQAIFEQMAKAMVAPKNNKMKYLLLTVNWIEEKPNLKTEGKEEIPCSYMNEPSNKQLQEVADRACTFGARRVASYSTKEITAGIFNSYHKVKRHSFQ